MREADTKTGSLTQKKPSDSVVEKETQPTGADAVTAHQVNMAMHMVPDSSLSPNEFQSVEKIILVSDFSSRHGGGIHLNHSPSLENI